MLHTTRGIVLKTFKYSENSVIGKIYTEKFGLRSYIFKGVSGKSKLKKKALLQGMTLLNMVAYEKPGSNLQNIKEIETAFAFQSIPLNIQKSSITLFLNEVIYKSIGEETPNSPMFAFLFDEIVKLDLALENYTEFHLFFLLNFSKFLGFMPSNTHSDKNKYFDLQEGVFVSQRPLHTNFLDEKFAIKLSVALSDQNQRLFNKPAERNVLLGKLIQYYSLHVPSFGELKSFAVLQQVLS